jgi:hypothetical protein
MYLPSWGQVSNLPAEFRANWKLAPKVRRQRYRKLSHVRARSGGRLSNELSAVVLLLGLGVAAAAWNIQPLPGQPTAAQQPAAAPEQTVNTGFDLYADPPPHKFNNTSAEAPQMPAPPPDTAEPPLFVLHEPPAPELTSPEPPAGLRDTEEPALVMPVVFYCPGSLDCSCFRDLHQGDTPMLRTWNAVKLSSVVAVALTVSPPLAVAQTEVPQNDLKVLRDSVDALSKKLDDTNANLANALAGIKSDMKGLYAASMDASLKMSTMEGSIDTLRNQVAALKADVDKLQGRGTVKYPGEKGDDLAARLLKLEELVARVADGRIAKSPPANTGRVEMVNRYPEEMLFVINQKSYRVAPYSAMTLDNQPPGTITYEVISGTYGSRGTNQPFLEAGKTLTITVR